MEASVEDEKKCFLNHFNLSKKSGDDISIWCLDKWQIFSGSLEKQSLTLFPFYYDNFSNQDS
jgi:hypothetical protein